MPPDPAQAHLPAITTRDLTRRFGDFVAVDRVTFQIEPGEVVGYLGPNGSGKTTTIRMLLGLLLPSGGHAAVLGYDVVRQPEQVRARVGYMSQKFALYHDLRVGENLAFYAGVYGVRTRRRLAEVLDLVGLKGLENQRVSELPAGWRQRLALGTAIVHHPGLLFLDEPTSGVDPGARRAFWDLIYELVAGGVTVFVTTHYMDEAEYCSRVGVMQAGRLLGMDSPAALKAGLPGLVWDLFVEDFPSEAAPGQEGKSTSSVLIAALQALEACPGVLRAGLVSSHLRVITRADLPAESIQDWLARSGVHCLRLERGEASLEDVFLALAKAL